MEMRLNLRNQLVSQALTPMALVLELVAVIIIQVVLTLAGSGLLVIRHQAIQMAVLQAPLA